MKGKKCATLLSVSLLLASVMASGISIAQAQAIPRSQRLVIGGDWSYARGLFNPFVRWGWPGVRGIFLQYMDLCKYNRATGQLEPWLAENFGWSENGSEFILNINPAARWHDGTPVTAYDVEFSFTSYLAYAPGFPLDNTIIENVTAVDNLTVAITVTPGNEFSVAALVNLNATPILQESRWSYLMGWWSEWAGDKIVNYPNTDYGTMDGCGPYRLTYADTMKSEFERVDDWWGNDIFGQPAPKYITLLAFATNDLVQRAFDDGVLDWCDASMTGALDYIRAHDDVTTWDENNAENKIFAGGAAVYLVPNLASTAHPELKEPWLRQAVAYALDMDDIVAHCWPGAMRANPSYVTPVGVGLQYIDYDLLENIYGAPEIPYDPEKAIEILQANCDNGDPENGWWLGGKKIGGWTIDTITGWTDVNLEAEMVCDYLEDIGIEATVNMISYGDYLARRSAGTFDWQDFSLGIFTEASVASFPINCYERLFTRDPGSAGYNSCRYSENTSANYDNVMALITELWSLQIGSEESIAKAHELQALLVPELPYIPLQVQTPMTRVRTNYWENWPNAQNPGPGHIATWWDDLIPHIILCLKSTITPPTPTPTPTATPTATPTPTPTATPTATPTPTPTATPTPTPTATPAPAETTWVWVGVGVVVIVIIVLLALYMMRRGK